MEYILGEAECSDNESSPVHSDVEWSVDEGEHSARPIVTNWYVQYLQIEEAGLLAHLVNPDNLPTCNTCFKVLNIDINEHRKSAEHKTQIASRQRRRRRVVSRLYADNCNGEHSGFTALKCKYCNDIGEPSLARFLEVETVEKNASNYSSPVTTPQKKPATVADSQSSEYFQCAQIVNPLSPARSSPLGSDFLAVLADLPPIPDSPMNCTACDKRCFSEPFWQRHIASKAHKIKVAAAKKTAKHVFCEFCKFNVNKNRWRVHAAGVKHKGNIPAGTSDNEPDLQTETTTATHNCKDCDKQFMTLSALNKHNTTKKHKLKIAGAIAGTSASVDKTVKSSAFSVTLSCRGFGSYKYALGRKLADNIMIEQFVVAYETTTNEQYSYNKRQIHNNHMHLYLKLTHDSEKMSYGEVTDLFRNIRIQTLPNWRGATRSGCPYVRKERYRLTKVFAKTSVRTEGVHSLKPYLAYITKEDSQAVHYNVDIDNFNWNWKIDHYIQYAPVILPTAQLVRDLPPVFKQKLADRHAHYWGLESKRLATEVALRFASPQILADLSNTTSLGVIIAGTPGTCKTSSAIAFCSGCFYSFKSTSSFPMTNYAGELHILWDDATVDQITGKHRQLLLNLTGGYLATIEVKGGRIYDMKLPKGGKVIITTNDLLTKDNWPPEFKRRFTSIVL